MTMQMAALAGANMIYGLGMIDLGMTLDFGQLVVDNEIAKMTRRILEGIPVSDDTVALDVIRAVGAGGHFLTERHTLKNMRKFQAQTRLFDRRPYAQWELAGRKDLALRASDEARKILENHKPAPLPKEIKAGLRSIVLAAADEFGIKITHLK
jgi:trimethylamine--corrinoid protein Co-methyltransferase